jgi:predicted GIY-YIG superfamily endonuclease
MNQQKNYWVYILTLKSEPVYVGMTSDILSRLKTHKKNKCFDNYTIVDVFDLKSDALISERSIIKYLSIFKNKNIINGLYTRFSHLKNYM